MAELCDVLARRRSPTEARAFWSESGFSKSGAFAVGVIDQTIALSNYKYADLKDRSTPELFYPTIDQYVASDPPQFLRLLSEILPLLGSAQRTQSVSTIASALRSSELDPQSSGSLIASYELVERYYPAPKSEIGPVLQKLVSDGTLAWYGHRAYMTDARTSALCILLLVKRLAAAAFNPSPDPHPILGDLATVIAWYQSIGARGLSDPVADALADAIVTSRAFSAWLRLAVADATPSRWFQDVASRSIEKGGAVAAELREVIDKFRGIQAALSPERASAILAQAAAQVTIDEARADLPDDDLVGLPRELLAEVSKLKSLPQLADISSRLDHVLEGKSEDDWREALRSKNDLLRALIARHDLDETVLPPHAYLPALGEFLSSTVQGGVSISDLDIAPQLLGALPKGSWRNLSERVLLSVPSTGAQIASVDALVARFPQIVDVMPWAKFGPQTVGLLRAAVASDQGATRNVIAAGAAAFSKVLKKSGELEMASFIELIDGIERIDEPHKEWIESVRRLLAIPAPPNAESKTESEPSDSTEEESH